MKPYQELLRDILEHGSRKGDRTGTGTLSVFGRQMRFDLSQGFPLVTTKRIHLKSVVHELLWFLSGDTNIRYLHDNGITIWDEWADENGSLGPVYGHQWRHWPDADGGEIDQIAKAVEQIRTNPNSRRILVTALNVAAFPDESASPVENARRGRMALAPCHAYCQFHVVDGRLSCLFFCRSQDTFLGTPFNIASYALLTHMVAQQCELQAGDLIWSGGDCHIYLNHLEQVNQQLGREPYPPPRLLIKRRPATIFDYRYEDFEFADYRFHPAIKAPIAV